MSETAAPPVPQTSNVFVDRPCLKCGYNLRGQTATWNRRALNWQVVCPECGGSQVVLLGQHERGALQNPIVGLALSLVGLWVVWQLFTWLSGSVSSMMEVPVLIDAPMNTAAARRAAMGASAVGAGVTTAFDGSWITLVVHICVRAVPVMLATFGFGIILAIAPYGRHRQRDLLLVVFVALACLYGVYLNITGVADPLSPVTRSALLQLVGASGIGTGGVLLVYDWKWRLVSGIIALMLAVIGGRIGLASGRPLGKIVTGMYVRVEE